MLAKVHGLPGLMKDGSARKQPAERTMDKAKACLVFRGLC